MSASNVDRIEDLVIPNGAAVSNSLFCDDDYGDAAALILHSPAGLDGGLTFNWQVSHDGTTWFDFQSGSPLADEAIPVAGNAAVYYGILAARYIRIAASGNVAAERTFIVTKHWTAA